jgi:hypothetical protein
MIMHFIEWKSSSFESSIKFSAVADGLPEKVWDETLYLFRMIGHEWKKLQNLSNTRGPWPVSGTVAPKFQVGDY